MRLETVEDLRKALDTTLDHLEGVLSSDPDMPSYQGTYDDASDWLDRLRAALALSERRDAVPPPPPPMASAPSQTQLSPALMDPPSPATTIPSPPPSAHDVTDES